MCQYFAVCHNDVCNIIHLCNSLSHFYDIYKFKCAVFTEKLWCSIIYSPDMSVFLMWQLRHEMNARLLIFD